MLLSCLIISDNLLSWDRVVLVVRLLAIYHVDFASLIQYEMHEWALKDKTTLPFVA